MHGTSGRCAPLTDASTSAAATVRMAVRLRDAVLCRFSPTNRSRRSSSRKGVCPMNRSMCFVCFQMVRSTFPDTTRPRIGGGATSIGAVRARMRLGKKCGPCRWGSTVTTWWSSTDGWFYFGLGTEIKSHGEYTGKNAWTVPFSKTELSSAAGTVLRCPAPPSVD